ncbi:MAG: universal stress protein [Hyphomicrobiales bacterium]|nr:universal stress protein [Hyphomicrobiales bacterium]
MYKSILIATDGSELADKAVVHGVGLAKLHQAKVTLVTVTEIWSAFAMAHDYDQHKRDPIGQYEAMAAEGAKRVLDKAAAVAREQGVECRLMHVPDKRPADGIIEAADEIGADLIVMASHGFRGLNRMLLGSQANEVVTRSKVPVLIMR